MSEIEGLRNGGQVLFFRRMHRALLLGVGVAVGFQASGCDGGGGAKHPLSGALSVAMAADHACAVMDDGTAKCWGGDALGQLGDGETTFAVPTPAAVLGLANVKTLALGPGHTCALATNGTVSCWGDNTACQLGNGCDIFGLPGSERGAFSVPTPVGVPGIASPALALATGASDGRDDGGDTCAILVGGTMACWGSNELGIDPDPMTGAIAPTVVAGVSNAIAMAVGGTFACDLLADGTVECWGAGPLGQPGANAWTSSATPVPVGGLSGVVALAAGSFHVCALLAAGTVGCWGLNSSGALGSGTLMDSPTPVMVNGVSGAVAIAAAGLSSYAVLSDGTVKAWGMNGSASTPVVVAGVTNALSISTADSSTCVVVAGGSIECWGDDSSGQLGTGVVIPDDGRWTTTPAKVVGGS